MDVAATFSAVFTPELFVLVVTLLLVGYETKGQPLEWQGLAARVVTIVGAWALAFLLYQGGPNVIPDPVPGGEDFFASTGLIAGFVVIWAVWERRGWGTVLSAYCLLLVVTSVIHLVVVPFWNMSSHVVYAAVPTGYLSTLDRRFTVSLLVPLGLVWSRVALEAHTVTEAVGGLLVAAVVVAGAILSGKVPGDRTVVTE